MLYAMQFWEIWKLYFILKAEYGNKRLSLIRKLQCVLKQEKKIPKEPFASGDEMKCEAYLGLRAERS